MNKRAGTTIAERKASARRRRPLYLRCINAVDLDTGEPMKAWVALTGFDRRLMKERGYHAGSEVRADFRKPRNVMFHRLSHALARMVGEQIEDFVGMDAHAILKKLQADSGAACDFVEYDFPGMGKVSVAVPRSLSFDEMDEGEFAETMRTIYLHIQSKYWPSMTVEAIEENVRMMEGNEQ